MIHSQFITIGSKGSAIPNIQILPARLRVGVNYPGPWQLGPNGHDPDLIKACAWVSESEQRSMSRTGKIEIYNLSEAVKNGRVIEYKGVEWTHKASGKSYRGNAYIPHEFLTAEGLKECIVIGVTSATWPHGRVERNLVADHRNRDQVILFNKFLKTLPK
ncbi:MAG: hypothetical protein ACO1QB_09285 [Verrucomicrobiales bacterium]